MSLHVGRAIFALFLGSALLLLPGFALLRLCLARRGPDLISRVALAPGITIAFSVLLFTWSDLFSIKLGPLISWLLLGGSLLVLLFGFRAGRRSNHLPQILSRNFRGMRVEEWFAAAALALMLVIVLIVRFRSTWNWVVPPGYDTAQHTIIVQLLLDHHGLFQSWAPYNEAETFTYHFGFHAITALFAWISGFDASTSVLIMSRLVGVAVAAVLFALVRLWTRRAWGGVFAALFWLLYTRDLYTFDPIGRWPLLCGLVVMGCALVLLSLYLTPFRAKPIGLGLLVSITIGGLALSQYRSVIIFAVLALALFSSRCVSEFVRHRRFGNINLILRRFAAVGLLAFFLAAPRLQSVMHAKTGRYFKHIVLESPRADSIRFDRPLGKGFGIFLPQFGTRRNALISGFALLTLIAVVWRRREALWFIVGWGAVCVVMNPTLLGIDRIGLIEEGHWQLAVQTAFAAVAGLGVGLICEMAGRRRSLVWNSVLLFFVVASSLWEVARPSPMSSVCRYVLPEDLPVLAWIERNVPNEEGLAGRAAFDHDAPLGLDAMTWLPYFTRHRTNQTNLVALMEQAPTSSREKLRDFSRQLYARDMSTSESARWMRGEGFQWFYIGANQPEWGAALAGQIARNPDLELVRAEGAARLYHLR
jgi:hypothetical protein